MIHRYNGYQTTTDHRYQWACTCNAQSAIRFDAVSGAKFDYLLHQQDTLTQGAETCVRCGDTTEEPFNADSAAELVGTVCEECYEATIPTKWGN